MKPAKQERCTRSTPNQQSLQNRVGKHKLRRITRWHGQHHSVIGAQTDQATECSTRVSVDLMEQLPTAMKVTSPSHVSLQIPPRPAAQLGLEDGTPDGRRRNNPDLMPALELPSGLGFQLTPTF